MKKLYICSNTSKQTLEIRDRITELLVRSGFEIADKFSDSVDMILVFGGDGAFLHALADCGYPKVPFLGINTGHLGFFQELFPDETDKLISFCSGEGFVLQENRLLKAEIETKDRTITEYALNDILVKDRGSSVIKLRLLIGDSFIEEFFGDGVLVSTAAGSTGYNYSLGGAIVDPRTPALQLTPCAPINNRAYRTFTSSLLLPPSLDIKAELISRDADRPAFFADGREIYAGPFKNVKFTLSNHIIKVVRNKDYNFWTKVQSKFL